ncbi:MAG TPA: phosphoglucomutase/phosphomannomutase family protein [Bacillota bacterium]
MGSIKFGTDGWRDLMYDRFNLANVSRVVEAIAAYTIEQGGADRGVVVGYDARFFSDFFATKASELLQAAGIKTYSFARDLPTPVVAYSVKKYKAFGAVMFTASHNPPAYNGIKFIPEYAGPATPEITSAIEAFIPAEAAPVKERLQRGQAIDPIPSYLEEIQKLVDVRAIKESGLEVGYDPMYGTGRGILDALLGGQVKVFHNRRDPLFGGGMPDPQREFLSELITWVQEGKNRIGLATDGDADRFGFVDDEGVYLTPNQILPLVLYHLVKNKGLKGVVGRSVATTHLLDALAAALGFATVETPVGFKYLGELMRKQEVIVAGEESGGLSIGGHIPEKDGILACALLTELRVMAGKPLSAVLQDIWQEVGSYYSQRLDLHLTEEKKERILSALQKNPVKELAGKKVIEVRKVDGIKFILEDGSWCLIRPSGTESLIRVYVEAHSQADLSKLSENAQEIFDRM